MQINIQGVGIKITEALNDFVIDKFKKLERKADLINSITVTLAVNKLDQIAKADIAVNGGNIHAEATSEKIAMGFYLDGKVTCVVGTHTHVQTADNRLLPKGTAYISDLGMVGPYNSSLGINVNNAIEKFITCRPVRFEVADGPNVFSAVVLETDDKTNRALSIERILFNETDV